MKEAFKSMDLNKDGVIVKEELAILLKNVLKTRDFSDELLDEMIILADINGDGVVDFDEFCKVHGFEEKTKMINTS